MPPMFFLRLVLKVNYYDACHEDLNHVFLLTLRPCDRRINFIKYFK